MPAFDPTSTMPTSALSSTPAPVAATASRLPWRAIAVLTGIVVAAHLVLLGAVPTSFGPADSPLSQHFITRTVVLAPPTPAAAQTPEPKAAAPKPAPHKEPRAPREPTPAPAATAPTPPAPPEAAITQADPTPETATVAPSPSSPPADPSGASGAQPGDAATAGTQSPAAVEPAAAPPEAAQAPTPAPQPAAEAPVPLRIPGSVRLKFAVTAQQGAAPMQGVFGELSWLQDGSNYDATLALSFFFKTLRQQHSIGAIGVTGIEPDRFSDTRKVEVASHFVRDQGTVVFSNNAPSVPLMPGAQDRLSVVMQLGALLGGDPARYPTGSVIAVQTVGPRDADIWLFKVGEAELLTLPAGQFTARKLTRSARKPFDDTVEVWVAPDIGYLPVRIKQTQPNGDFADMQLREQLPPKAPN
ncbi:hypothetical protein BH10PSE18_BH10PSE18_09970 [soil metagenome]